MSQTHATEKSEIQTYLFIFYNPYSGNRQGNHLKKYAAQHARFKKDLSLQVQFYDITEENERVDGVDYLVHLLQTSDAKFIVTSAGGDGTFVGILQYLLDRGVGLKRDNLSFSVFAFGTGNDLSQSMGWGRYIPFKDTECFDTFAKYIQDRTKGVRSPMDIWKVRVVPHEGGYIRKSRPKTKGFDKYYTEDYTRLMSNYLTLGLQGIIGTRFERHRRYSRMWNAYEYAKQSFLKAILHKIPRVTEYVDTITVGNDVYNFVESPVELFFQNLTGIWGRRMKVWDWSKLTDSIVRPATNGADIRNWHRSELDDGRLDVFGIKSRTSYFLKQIPCLLKNSELQRVGQFADMTIQCKKDKRFYMMLDGEFFEMYNIDRIILEHAETITSLCHVQPF